MQTLKAARVPDHGPALTSTGRILDPWHRAALGESFGAVGNVLMQQRDPEGQQLIYSVMQQCQEILRAHQALEQVSKLFE